MTIIFHITTRTEWDTAQESGEYTAPSLLTEGFIHCSTAAQVVLVANAFYRDVPDLVLLCIEEDAVVAAVKWEAPAHPEGHVPPPDSDTQLFPHVYGAINLDAVVKVVDLPQGDDGFALPGDI